MQSISNVPGPGRFVSETVLEALTDATTKHVTVTMSYYAASTDEHTVRELDVYQLTHRQNDWYAVGYCHLRQALRTFAVSRIRDVIKTSKHYTIPADFDGEAYFKTAFGVEITDTPAEEVHLHFDKGSSRWVKERHWHATQRLVPQEDGSLYLYLAAGNTYELRQWILSFGARVEVIAPHSLRLAIIDEIRAAARRYEDAPAG